MSIELETFPTDQYVIVKRHPRYGWTWEGIHPTAQQAQQVADSCNREYPQYQFTHLHIPVGQTVSAVFNALVAKDNRQTA